MVAGVGISTGQKDTCSLNSLSSLLKSTSRWHWFMLSEDCNTAEQLIMAPESVRLDALAETRTSEEADLLDQNIRPAKKSDERRAGRMIHDRSNHGEEDQEGDEGKKGRDWRLKTR